MIGSMRIVASASCGPEVCLAVLALVWGVKLAEYYEYYRAQDGVINGGGAKLTISLPTRNRKHNPLRIYSLNLDQSQTFITSPLNASLSRQQEHFYSYLSLKTYTHSTTSVYSLPTISSVRLLRILIDMRVYRDYMYHKRGRENGQNYSQRSYTYFSAQLYIWESMKSLQLRSIGIQTLIRALYIRFQPIYHSAALSKSRGFAIFHALRVIKERGITCLAIRSSSISLNLLLLRFKLRLNDITLFLK